MIQDTAHENEKDQLTTNRKAFLINLNPSIYGTFAEIGAGQEVARHFFKVGGAAGTIAKSMSAYDMKFSDEIYGKSERYVSRGRLIQMLDHEYSLLTQRLSKDRGKETQFFVFANTVAAASYSRKTECHGWMGVRYQLSPESPPNDIYMHVRLWDKTNLSQQDALGIAGVNFLWAAFNYSDDQEQFVKSLIDFVGSDRIEVDMLEFFGPQFKAIDNRILSLELVKHGLTNAVMFGPNKSILQPSSALRKKAVLLERGSFRPLTHVNIDMIRCACTQFMQEAEVQGENVIPLLEITMKNLLASGDIDNGDFLARVDTISAIGYHVMVSNYQEYFRLSSFFRRYTDRMLGFVLGINHLQAIFNEHYYTNLEGGILESFGRLFKDKVRMYVYPMKGIGYDSYQSGHSEQTLPPFKGDNALIHDSVITANNLQVKTHLRHLYGYLLENHFIEPIVGANLDYLDIYSRDILAKIKKGDPTWEKGVPELVAAIIKEKKLWGYQEPKELKKAEKVSD